MKNRNIVTLGLSAVLVGACGGGSDDDDTSGAGALPNQIGASVIVDVNSDGKNDIVMGGDGYSALLLLQNENDGSSFIKKTSAFPTQYKGSNGSAVVIEPGDFDGDGKLDLLTATTDVTPGSFYSSAQIQLYLGNGDGTFRDASTNITNGIWPATIAPTSDEITNLGATYTWPDHLRVSDIDGDGSLDFVATADGGGRGGIIYLNNGQGHFAPATVTLTEDGHTGTISGLARLNGGWGGTRVVDLLPGDINKDGKVDFFAPGGGGYNTTFINTSTPNSVSFTAIQTHSEDRLKNGVMLDVNGDGELDVVGSLSIGNTLSPSYPVIALVGDGTGHFTTDTNLLSPQPTVSHARQFLASDINGDGYQDVLIADHGWDHVPFPGARNWLLINNGSGVLVDKTSTSLDLLPSYTHQAAIGDFTGDGMLDILLNNSNDCGSSSAMTCAKEPRFWKNVGNGALNAFDPTIR